MNDPNVLEEWNNGMIRDSLSKEPSISGFQLILDLSK